MGVHINASASGPLCGVQQHPDALPSSEKHRSRDIRTQSSARAMTQRTIPLESAEVVPFAMKFVLEHCNCVAR